MISINLLPWRAQQHQEQRRKFYLFLSIAIGSAIFFCALLHVFFSQQLKTQLRVNMYLNNQITSIDQQIIVVNKIKQQKETMLRRLTLVEGLQTDRVRAVKMFYDFVKVLPPGIYLTQIKKVNNDIIVNGRAQSNEEISQLMANINTSSSFEHAVLAEIKETPDPDLNPTNIVNQIYGFSFELRMQPLNETTTSKDIT